jgi:methylamine--corrinoid protein Co-methyltransferase
MINLLEVAERARSGPRIGEKEWNLGLFRKMQQLAKDYKLEYSGPDLFFSVDDNYADNAFQAAVDFISSTGVYCVSTNRAIQFTEEEVREAVREAPKEITVGEGRDIRRINKREMESKSPVSIIGGGHCPWSEKLIPLPHVVKGFAEVVRNDIIESYNFTVMDGREILGLPMEAYAARKAIAWVREGVKEAGRPGMAITYYPISTRASTLIAPMDPNWGIRRTDGVLLTILPDIKVEYDLLTAAIIYEEHGSYKVNGGAWANVGGFCGGNEGAIIETIAKAIAAWMIYRDSLQYECFVVSGVHEQFGFARSEELGKETGPKAMFWPSYVTHRALDRNSSIIRFGGGGPGRAFVADVCTEESWLMWAVSAITSTVLGSNIFMANYHTPLDVKWVAEASDATIRAGIKRGDLGKIIQRIEEKIEEKSRRGVQGRALDRRDRRLLAYDSPQEFFEPLRECYDFVKQQPTMVAVENYKKAKGILTDLGLEFAE